MQATTIDNHIIQSRPLDIRLNAVYLERGLYDNYPPFQRDKVWPLTMKQSLIDSILRGFYISPILVYPKEGEPGYWVLDGQQRLSTIFEFMDNHFTTAKDGKSKQDTYSPLEAGRSYSQLPGEAIERFRSYPLHFLVLERTPEHLIGELFRRLQNQVPLSPAEKLWSYTSQATKAAITLSSHHYFSEIYHGRKTRKETFQASMYPLAIEIAHGYVNVQSDHIRRLAAGAKDDSITASLIQQIARRLDFICYLFSGTKVNKMTEIIIFYQAALFLEEAGYDIANSVQGCLTPWYHTIEQQNVVERGTGYMRMFSQMVKVSYQKHFWLRNLPEIARVPGLASSNKVTSLSHVDSIAAWIRQNGICLNCRKAVELPEITQHIFREADRHRATPTCLPEEQRRFSLVSGQ